MKAVESGNVKSESRDPRMWVVAVIFGLLLLPIMFLSGYAVGGQRALQRQAPCAPVASVADRYELRETGVVGLMLRLDKQTGETVPISAMSSR